MLFYLLVVPTLIGLLIVICRFYRVKKRDEILFELYQLKREFVDVLKKENLNLSKEGYISLKEMAESLDTAIHNYEDGKVPESNLPVHLIDVGDDLFDFARKEGEGEFKKYLTKHPEIILRRREK